MQPEERHAVAFNQFELLRDPSHVKAFPKEELSSLFTKAGFPVPSLMTYRMHSDIDSLLARSFPATEADAREVRALRFFFHHFIISFKAREMFVRALKDDFLGVQPKQTDDGKIHYSLPVGCFLAENV